MKKSKYLLLSLGIVVVLVSVILITVAGAIVSNNQNLAINSFADCEAAGLPIQESYPRRCTTTDGRSFTETITTTGLPYPVGVFFSKNPESVNDFTYVVRVERTTTDSNLIDHALKQLISGPNSSETQAGLFTPISLKGDSTCNGDDFQTTLNDDKVVRIYLCKDLVINGVGDAARVQTVLERTLIGLNEATKYELYRYSDESPISFSEKGD